MSTRRSLARKKSRAGGVQRRMHWSKRQIPRGQTCLIRALSKVPRYARDDSHFVICMFCNPHTLLLVDPPCHPEGEARGTFEAAAKVPRYARDDSFDVTTSAP